MNCGPYCLQYVHRKNGKKLSIKYARQLCHTTRQGTTHGEMCEALDTLGYSTRVKERVKWWELNRYVKAGNDVFVSWWSDLDAGGVPVSPDGHWSVVTSMTKDDITLWDPDPAIELTLPRLFFESRWWDWEKEKNGPRKDLLRAAIIAKPKR